MSLALGQGLEQPNQTTHSSAKRIRMDDHDTSNGGQTSDQTTTGLSEGWIQNRTVNTCVCELCGDKVNKGKWSYKCTTCLRHICSQCLGKNEKAAAKSAWHHEAATNQLTEGCWCHRWRSNMNPAFARTKPRSAPRPEEEERAKDAKGKARATHSAKAMEKRTVAKKTVDEEQSSHGSSIEKVGEANDSSYSYDDPTASGSSGPHASLKRKRSANTDAADIVGLPGNVEKNRKKLKRDRDSDLLESNSLQREKAQSRPHHLQDGHTIIVGAGMVGLFVARELARAKTEANIRHEIIVIEVRSKPCELASGHCNGILTTVGMPEDWDAIAQLAKHSWFDLLESPVVRSAVDFSSSTLLRAIVSDEEGEGQGEHPSWFTRASRVNLEKDISDIGRIDSNGLAEWLYRECQNFGVQFHLDCDIAWPEFSKSAALQQVTVVPNDGDRTGFWLPCTNLILAAGPFTTYLLTRKLFQECRPVVENHIQAAHWIRIAAPRDYTATDGVSLRLANAAQNDKNWEGELFIRGDATNRSLVVSGFSGTTKNRDIDTTHATQHRNGKAAELAALAAPYLHLEDESVIDGKHLLAKGRFNVSVGYNDSPVIDQVPIAALGLSIDEIADDMHPCGVFLCYGFGKYGTMLAPGAAKMLVEQIFDGGADREDFRLPPHETSTEEDVWDGKRKGKARAMDQDNGTLRAVG